MEDPKAENVTNARTPPGTEQTTDEKYLSDPAETEFEAVSISPREETSVRSPLVDLRFHATQPSEGQEVFLETATPRADMHSPSSLEDEQAPFCEAVQAAAEPHRVSHAEEDEVLASEKSFVCVEHNGPILLEGGEALVPEPATPPPQEYMEASLGPAQGGAEPYDGFVKGEFDPDPVYEVVCDEVAGHEIVMAGDQVKAAWDEVTEEAVESAGEGVDAAGSGDGVVISENEFAVTIDVRRRGARRRKRSRASSKVQGTRFPSRKKVEEEVCFICFDGGDLVVCDRRGCPKVYHPSCVNREESYFQSKGQWSCGWHICSKCQKPAGYMCYTCTYSLCKACVNEAEFTCVRGKKGFCPSCMGTILLMETSENADEKKDGVDFNDRSCWEFLFKDYWLELKGKLSLNLDEIAKARVASKVCSIDIANEESSDDEQGASSDRFSACQDESILSKKKLNLSRTPCEISGKDVQIERMSPPESTSRKRMKKHSRNANSLIKEEKTEFSTVHQGSPLLIKVKKRSRKTVNEEGTANDTESEVPAFKKTSRKKHKRKSRRAAEENLLGDVDKGPTTALEDDNWASKELLAFVSHVKNGDKGILSQYDVQELLLDYIKVNKLRDPRRRSQIICDKMLLALFGKSRVGHFEMLKLIESHFLIKVSSPESDEKQGGDTNLIEMGNEVINDLMITNKRCITWKRVDSKLQANFYDYAAIDVYNINMMYLRRSLMEELLDDMSTFSEKVFGSFVRIRVTASSQKQEVYRLVQVVGCGKAPEEYKTGKRATDVMLEIINLDKKEVITIDIISNQDFTEEECKRLRQSIKFGFISRLTVGEVQEKARVLHAVRVSDHLESEKLRLTHLRDRASEKGRKKEHRECVEKLQLLNSPEEQMKRLEAPDIHVDPKMDPSYESPEEDGDEDENKEGNPMEPTFKGRELIFPQKEDGYNWSGAPKSSNNVDAMGRARYNTDFQSMELQSTMDVRASEFLPQKIDEKIHVETQKIESKAPAVEPLSENKEPLRESVVQIEPKLETLPAKVDPQSNTIETEKLWHYKDPSGKIQGPFSMVQLRKWSKHFPSNLGIWRKWERQEDSILLTDALAGNFQKDLPAWVVEDIKPTQLVKTSETTLVGNSADLSSSSPSIINTSKMHGTATSLSIYIEKGNHSKSDYAGVPAGQSSLGSHLVYQNTAPQNDQSVSIAACTDLIANLDNKHGTGNSDFYKTSIHEQVVVNAVNSESTQQVSFDLHNQPAVIPSEMDPGKEFLEQPGTTPGRTTLSMHGNNIQPRTDVAGEVSAFDGYATQKHDLAILLNSDSCSNHAVSQLTDKLIDHSTSSTESNTVPQVPPCDLSHTRFQKVGALDVKSAVASNALDSVSPQRSDASTLPKAAPEILQSAYTNSFTKNSGTSFATVHPLNTCDQAQSQNAHPNHLVPQTVGSGNWNVPNDARGREQSTPYLNSTTVLSSLSTSVSTSVNCQNTLLVSSDVSKPFSSSQLSNSTSAVTFQPPNMSWGAGTPEVNNQSWQVANQFQNFSNVAAAVGNFLCGSGIQGGFGAANNLGWGMMAQGNMNMPWVVPPNANFAWGQGVSFPSQGNASSNFVWGAPQVSTIPNDGCRPVAQGNVASYPFWNAPLPGNTSQNPVFMPAPVVGNMNQNAWGIPNQVNTGAINTPRIGHESKTSTWDSTKENPSNSTFRNDKFRERNFGSRNGDFRGTGSGYGSGRQSRNWMPSGNAEGPSRPHPEHRRICEFHENGNCKKGSSCNYIHS
ncbi:zinc finger CCCH domain-containing protein 19-like [Phalaenopsis equestris]|uniref:zinc finger CCCH domain-containing protein 19-like n=1 Tax=Phalaenopsis equestris TaxID=78828 RepID=UPI0009E3C11C|nr:zinc finger CCCH domain-containing protein 19-like [Phalaenopsis equestris]